MAHFMRITTERRYSAIILSVRAWAYFSAPILVRFLLAGYLGNINKFLNVDKKVLLDCVVIYLKE